MLYIPVCKNFCWKSHSQNTVSDGIIILNKSWTYNYNEMTKTISSPLLPLQAPQSLGSHRCVDRDSSSCSLLCECDRTPLAVS